MPITLGMFEKSYDHIKPKLDGLKLDLDVRTFAADGTYGIGGKRVPASDADIDYLWLSQHINAGGMAAKIFEIVDQTRKVGVLQTFNAGLDNPFYKRMSNKGTRICNSSAQGIAIAEYTLGQVLAVLQPIGEQRALQAERTWKATPFRELSETKWLIIGFGPIGQEIARRVRAFGAAVSVVRRNPQPTPLADKVGTMADLPVMLPDADVVVLACPLNDSTRNFADDAVFGAMKKGTILVNIARGALIVDAALIKAMDAGTVATAVLDVFRQEPLPADNPLWSHPGVRLTSHTSFFGSGMRKRLDTLFLDNIARFARGEPLAQLVDPKDI